MEWLSPQPKDERYSEMLTLRTEVEQSVLTMGKHAPSVRHD